MRPRLDRDDEKAAEGVDISPELAAASSGFRVQLPAFEGPLDLLLHLIREHKLDIFDIPIAFVSERYLEHMERMRELNLDVAGEFLVMAATLAHIKSRLLLPRPETPEEDAPDPGDPRADLVRRLLEYQKYRAAAEDLARQDLLGRNVFTRQARPGEPPPLDGEVPLREVSVFKLIESFDRVLSQLKPEKAHEVRLERVTITDAIHRLSDRLRETPQITFLSLFEGLAERHRVIAAFLGLLEMVRLKLVRVLQPAPDRDILIEATELLGDGEAGPGIRDDFR